MTVERVERRVCDRCGGQTVLGPPPQWRWFEARVPQSLCKLDAPVDKEDLVRVDLCPDCWGTLVEWWRNRRQ